METTSCSQGHKREEGGGEERGCIGRGSSKGKIYQGPASFPSYRVVHKNLGTDEDSSIFRVKFPFQCYYMYIDLYHLYLNNMHEQNEIKFAVKCFCIRANFLT